MGRRGRRFSKMASHYSYKIPAGLSRTRLTLLAAWLCLPSLFAQAQSSGYLTAGEPQKTAGKRGAAVQVKIPVAVKEGYHVNSNQPSEEYPTQDVPSRFTTALTYELPFGKGKPFLTSGRILNLIAGGWSANV